MAFASPNVKEISDALHDARNLHQTNDANAGRFDRRIWMKTTSTLAALLLCFSLTALQSARAQDAAPQASQPQRTVPQAAQAQVGATQAAAAPIDPAKKAEILKFMELTGMTKVSQNLAAQMVDQMRPAILRSLPPGGRSEEIVDAFSQKFKARVSADSLTNLMIPVYDKYLSREDLEGLIQFFQTPLGQKMIRITPQISKESYKIGSDWGQQTALEVIHEMTEQYPELKSIQ
jgi:uncharacterized protein